MDNKTSQRQGIKPQAARYLPQDVPDYKGNPLIEALPQINTPYEAAKLLAVYPEYHDGERELDEQRRKHCIGRLFRYFQPLDVHLDIEQRVSIAIRQSYVSKNPVSSHYAAGLAEGAAAIRTGYFNAANDTRSTASGFAIIGLSGVGKTTAIERVLSLYPQTILHTHYSDTPLFLTQLVWAKLDCPFDGSLKGLCMSFFDYVDNVLGTDYAKKFSVHRMTVDSALPRMAQIARNHCLGMIVIDEIQHLNQAKSGGQAKMLNFFVTLVNTVGVPVVLIGTSKAKPILQSEFRQARRSSGQQGDLLWERMQNDESWELMLRAMWKNQWTQKHTSLTAELKNVLYDESQGIIDIAVKLYALAQIKVIADGAEEVTAKSIREVASEKLKLVRSALDALRTGDAKKLAQYEDIMPITVDDYFAAQSSRLPSVPDWGKEDKLSLEEEVTLLLLRMGVPSSVAQSVLKKVIGESAVRQTLSDVISRAYTIVLDMERSKNKPEQYDMIDMSGDLRNTSDGDLYNELKSNGSIAGTTDEF
jgi:hypothetical protein